MIHLTSVARSFEKFLSINQLQFPQDDSSCRTCSEAKGLTPDDGAPPSLSVAQPSHPTSSDDPKP